MGRPKKNRDEIIEDGEVSDRDAENSVAGIAPRRLHAADSGCKRLDEKLATLRGEKSGILKEFEDRGGNKKSFKEAQKIMSMEHATARDYIRTRDAYLTELGFFNQLDMFDKQNSLEPTTEPLEMAGDDEDAVAPRTIGQQQADAFVAAHGAH